LGPYNSWEKPEFFPAAVKRRFPHLCALEEIASDPAGPPFRRKPHFIRLSSRRAPAKNLRRISQPVDVRNFRWRARKNNKT